VSHSQNLARRRQELVERSAAQRAALLASAEPIARKAARVDRVLAYVRRYPVLSSVAVGAVALLGPRKMLDYGTRAITLYSLLRR